MNWDKYRDEMDSINFDSEFYSRTLSSLNDHKKPIRTARPKKAVIITLVIAVIAALGITAMAVKPQLSTEEAVLQCLKGVFALEDEKIDPKMAAAIESGKAQVVEVNQSQTSDGKLITLLGYITGKDISQFSEIGDSDYDPNREYTYVVFSVANANGTDYTGLSDGEFTWGHYLPAGVKITPEDGEMLTVLGGDGRGYLVDGVLYFYARCDSINNYDGNVYFAVNVSKNPVDLWDFWFGICETMPEDGPTVPAHTGAMVVFKLPK